MHFAETRREGIVLLIDTYDTEATERKVVALTPRLKQQGLKLKGVRVGSGGLAEHTQRVRAVLDTGDFRQVQIFASGGLDEWALRRFVAGVAPMIGSRNNSAFSQAQPPPWRFVLFHAEALETRGLTR